MAVLPYVTSPGNIEKALRGIQSAATPEVVSQDFVKTILGIPGGSGNQITSFLRKIGFAGTDGKPTQRYVRFRNPATAGAAIADAIREAYAPLYARNEYLHRIPDEDLKGLIIEETGAAEDSTVPSLVLAAINALKSFADFEPLSQDVADEVDHTPTQLPAVRESLPPVEKGVGLNLSYTINLNLPATTDIAVFNAIFKSLKENLLRDTM